LFTDWCWSMHYIFFMRMCAMTKKRNAQRVCSIFEVEVCWLITTEYSISNSIACSNRTRTKRHTRAESEGHFGQPVNKRKSDPDPAARAHPPNRLEAADAVMSYAITKTPLPRLQGLSPPSDPRGHDSPTRFPPSGIRTTQLHMSGLQTEQTNSRGKQREGRGERERQGAEE
jgi:hypothetical protein